MENKFYTIDKVAEMLGMHHKTIRKFIADGRLIANKVGKQWRISAQDLNLFLEGKELNDRGNELELNEEISFTVNDENSRLIKSKLNVSTVIEINEVKSDQYTKTSNMLLAIMNCKDDKLKHSTIKLIYSKESERLRIMLWGTTDFIKDMLDTVTVLIEDSEEDK